MEHSAGLLCIRPDFLSDFYSPQSFEVNLKTALFFFLLLLLRLFVKFLINLFFLIDFLHEAALNEGLAINDVTPFLRFLIFSSSSLSPILPNRKTYSEMPPLEIPSFPHRRRRHLCILAFL